MVMHGIMDEDVRKEAEFEAPIKSAVLFYPQNHYKDFRGKIETPAIFITGDEDYICMSRW